MSGLFESQSLIQFRRPLGYRIQHRVFLHQSALHHLSWDQAPRPHACKGWKRAGFVCAVAAVVVVAPGESMRERVYMVVNPIAYSLKRSLSMTFASLAMACHQKAAFVRKAGAGAVSCQTGQSDSENKNENKKRSSVSYTR